MTIPLKLRSLYFPLASWHNDAMPSLSNKYSFRIPTQHYAIQQYKMGQEINYIAKRQTLKFFFLALASTPIYAPRPRLPRASPCARSTFSIAHRITRTACRFELQEYAPTSNYPSIPAIWVHCDSNEALLQAFCTSTFSWSPSSSSRLYQLTRFKSFFLGTSQATWQSETNNYLLGLIILFLFIFIFLVKTTLGGEKTEKKRRKKTNYRLKMVCNIVLQEKMMQK